MDTTTNESFPVPPRPVLQASSAKGFYLLDVDALLDPTEEFPATPIIFERKNLKQLRAILNGLDLG